MSAWMTIKCAALNLPYGGAKAASASIVLLAVGRLNWAFDPRYTSGSGIVIGPQKIFLRRMMSAPTVK
ncbi:hypothetical protein KCP75_06175 [Salmonella enterica subsp. enterica]|nr:hypothetical protein KCP75_06175 [Salmonella enterica subsp. enterica]